LSTTEGIEFEAKIEKSFEIEVDCKHSRKGRAGEQQNYTVVEGILGNSTIGFGLSDTDRRRNTAVDWLVQYC